ncbi:MAG TPA: 50S ribosomal protein L24 [Polyangiaceae bacterium]
MQRLRKGDLVVVISGDDKGKQGKVVRVLAERNAVVVEGVNRNKRHVKSMPERPGGIMEVDAPIAASKVMPVDSQTGKGTRVKYQIVDGKKVRIAKSGATVTVQE